MDELGKQLSIISLIVIFVIGLLGIIQGKKILEVFNSSVSLAVAAIPEGLPVVVAVTLALGILRLSTRKVIVKKLTSVESLGAVGVICFDKTGTLTENQMAVAKLICCYDSKHNNIEELLNQSPNRRPDLVKLIEVSNICNNSYWEDNEFCGQPTEISVMQFITKIGLPDLRQVFVINRNMKNYPRSHLIRNSNGWR